MRTEEGLGGMMQGVAVSLLALPVLAGISMPSALGMPLVAWLLGFAAMIYLVKELLYRMTEGKRASVWAWINSILLMGASFLVGIAYFAGNIALPVVGTAFSGIMFAVAGYWGLSALHWALQSWGIVKKR